MRSKISCFDAGIAHNLARRFWPLWAVYFAAMVVAFPLELTSVTIYSYAQANARVLECAMQSVRVAIPAGDGNGDVQLHVFEPQRRDDLLAALAPRDDVHDGAAVRACADADRRRHSGAAGRGGRVRLGVC